MSVKIEERRDYELHINKLINDNIKLKTTMSKVFKSLAMQCFDDGITFNQANLFVKVKV